MANDPSVLIDQLKELKRWATNDFTRLAARRTEDWVKGNFRRQSFGATGAKWQSRQDDTRKGGAILIGKQSGLLRDAVRAVANGGQITVSNDRVYALIHNEGGTIVQNVTDKQRSFFWAKHYEAKAASQAVLAERWKRMALSKTLHITIPQRQFMPKPNDGVPDELAAVFVTDIEKKMDSIFK
jgi:phage gpG-like protein